MLLVTLAQKIPNYAIAVAFKRSRGAHLLTMRPVSIQHMQVPPLVCFCVTGGLLPSCVKGKSFMDILLTWHRGQSRTRSRLPSVVVNACRIFIRVRHDLAQSA